MSPSLADAAASVTQIIHDARWMAGLTQAEVAQRAGVSQQTVALYEGGKRQPSLATLSRLVGGCGLQLAWNLVPVAGLEDESTLDLLALLPLERLEAPMAAALTALALAAHSVEVLVSGRTAARLHGAAVRVYELELWVDQGVDLEDLTAYLKDAGVVYVTPFGLTDAAVPERERLMGGWPLVAPGANLWLRAVPDFSYVVSQSIDVAIPGGRSGGGPGGGNVMVASVNDCTRGWSSRDLDRLALQRAVRLAERLRA